MNTALRAAADRFIYDIAALRAVGDSLEEAEFDAICPATGHSVVVTFAQLVEGYRAAARAVRVLAESASAPQDWPPEPEPPDPATLPAPGDIDGALAHAVRELLQALAALPAPRVTSAVEKTVVAWSRTGSLHAIDFFEAVPALAADPLLLSWALFPLPGEPRELHGRRLDVLKRARAAPENQR